MADHQNNREETLPGGKAHPLLSLSQHPLDLRAVGESIRDRRRLKRLALEELREESKEIQNFPGN